MGTYKINRTQNELRIDLEKKRIVIVSTGTKGNPIIFDSHQMLELSKKRTASAIMNLKPFREKVTELDDSILLNETIGFLAKKVGKILFVNEIKTFTKESNYKVDIPLEYLKQTLERYSEDNLNLEPDFQRAHVWTKQQQIAFMEYMLKEGRINPIYFNHPNWMNFNSDEKVEFVIVDGKQRLKAAIDFLDDKFRVFKDLDEEDKGFFYSELSRVPSTLSFNFQINTLKTKKEVLQWYLDLNTGGTQHKKAELEKVRTLLQKEGE